MSTLAIVLVVVIAAAAIFIYVRDPIRAWRRYRQTRLVVCPETAMPAAVRIDTGHAALTALVESRPEVRLAFCSRWQERGICREPCLSDVEASGIEGSVEWIVAKWFSKQPCAYCGKPIEAAQSHHHPAALKSPDGATVEWVSLPPERLPELFRSHQPVCWNCHITESFRRTHPELVVDRSNWMH